MKASQPKSAKRDLLLQSAQRLMLRSGYWATSVDDICEASSVSKGVFFHYFTSKKDLGERTLQYFFDDIAARLSHGSATPPEDPLERVQMLIRGMAQILSSREGPNGCLIATFTIDTAEIDPELRTRCAAYFEGWSRLLQQHLQNAINQYAPQAPIDSAQLAYYCISVLEGSLLLVRAQQNTALLSQNIELLMTQLHCVLSRPVTGANLTRAARKNRRKRVRASQP